MTLRPLFLLGFLLTAGVASAQTVPKRPPVLRTAAETARQAKGSAASRKTAKPVRHASAEAKDATDAPPEADVDLDEFFAADASEQTVRPYEESPAAPKTRSTTPPPGGPVTADPPRADWGNIQAPRRTPTIPPPVDYLLVRPPEGVMQQWDAGFQQRVVNPEETFHHGPVFCDGVELDRPDGLAPIGVIGDHTLEAGGQFLISYRYNVTSFDGLRDGTSNLSSGSVLNTFPVAPTNMQTQRHTALIEYGVTDDLTVLALLPFWDLQINQVTGTGQTITNANTDPGDVIVQALYVLWRGDRQQVHLNMGLQIPLGMQGSERYPPTPDSPAESYPLRTSSGTYDFMPGATYRGQNDDWTWGFQGIGTIRFGLNNLDYKLGNRLEMTGWLARKLSDNLSLSARLDGNLWANIFGADPRLNQALVPTNVPNDQGGRRLDMLFGANVYIPGDYIHAQWFSVEGGFPAYQSLFGPQLKATWMINAGYNLRF